MRTPIFAFLLLTLATSFANAGPASAQKIPSQSGRNATHKQESKMSMPLGNFCLSLAVRDLATSRAFYKKLGFSEVGGDGKHWLVLRNGDTKIGLFQGMFDKNILTFNPGWNADGKTLERFVDVREIQAELKAAGIPLALETPADGEGPGHIVFSDPDGNQIMLDQHVGKPDTTK
jgi:lactoylglutathione lyase